MVEGMVEGTVEGNQSGYRLMRKEVVKAFGWMVRMGGGRCMLIKRGERRTTLKPASYRSVPQRQIISAISTSGQVTHHPSKTQPF